MVLKSVEETINNYRVCVTANLKTLSSGNSKQTLVTF